LPGACAGKSFALRGVVWGCEIAACMRHIDCVRVPDVELADVEACRDIDPSLVARFNCASSQSFAVSCRCPPRGRRSKNRDLLT